MLPKQVNKDFFYVARTRCTQDGNKS